MRRHHLTPRRDRQDRARILGFDYANIGGEPYWDETACWEFTANEVDALENATAELEGLAQAAADHAVRHARHAILGIPQDIWPHVVRSWERQEPSLYGRMDLRWDGSAAPKLLEYNADTPTSLYETAVVQWEWLTCTFPSADQFNSIHEALLAAWPDLVARLGLAAPQVGLPAPRVGLAALRGLDLSATIHFTCDQGSAEDRGNVDYLRDTAMQAGLNAPFLDLQDIGWDGRRFVDLDNRAIDAAFKLYPWELLLRDSFGHHVVHAATRWIEPAWRLMLASKGLLALLWELFPGHPNLLPAFRQPGRTGQPEIAKPLFGREGANITAPGWQTDGPYGAEGFVHQAWAPLPRVDGRYAVLGSWLIAGKPHGIGIREDSTPITRDTSRFVPHFFRSDMN